MDIIEDDSPTRVVMGRIKVHPDGYAFVVPDDPGIEDIHVNARSRGPAMDADRVEVEWWVGARGLEGRVRKVLERGRGKITGQIQGHGKNVHLIPDDPRITGPVVLKGGAHGAKVGEAVVAEIARYPMHPQDAMEVTVLKTLGDPDDPRTEVEKILACADVTEEFPGEVARAASHVPTEVRPNDRKDRVDLRHIPFMTIDPETARDFDDAVAVEAAARRGRSAVGGGGRRLALRARGRPAGHRGPAARGERLLAQPGHPDAARGAVVAPVLAGAGAGPAGDGGAHRLRPRGRSSGTPISRRRSSTPGRGWTIRASARRWPGRRGASASATNRSSTRWRR